MQTVPTAHPYVHVRLVIESFDSSEECSLQHLVEVRSLVDQENIEGVTDIEFQSLEPEVWN